MDDNFPNFFAAYSIFVIYKPPKFKNRIVSQKYFLKHFSEVKLRSAYWKTSQNWKLTLRTGTLLKIETQLSLQKHFFRIETFKCVRYSQIWNRKMRTETLTRIETQQQHSVVEPEPQERQEPQLFAFLEPEP